MLCAHPHNGYSAFLCHGFRTAAAWALISRASATSQQQCYTFYDTDFSAGDPGCPESCPHQTQCLNDDGRTSCTRSDDCAYLLPYGQTVNFTWIQEDGSVIHSHGCVSCLEISGCEVCEGGLDGRVLCKQCGAYFKEDGFGRCIWDMPGFDALVYCFVGLIIFLACWILLDIKRAECAPITNRSALERGLKLRRRVQLFMPSGTSARDGDARRLHRYPLDVNLHSRRSGSIMGPGLTLFMNWFFFAGAAAVWLLVGAYIHAPSSSEELDHLSPCRQVSRALDGWDFKAETPLLGDRDGMSLRWAAWNYGGVVAMTAVFLYGQQQLWSGMVEDSHRPSLREYCVQLCGLPPDQTDKVQIREKLGDWLERLRLDRKGIIDISIAYAVPSEKHDAVHKLIEKHVKDRILHSTAPLAASGCSTTTFAAGEGQAPWLFWIRLVASILLGTPFWRDRQMQVIPQEVTPKHNAARALLSGLKGSGYAFVVMETEALACAVSGMGMVQLDGISDKPIMVRDAPGEPPVIRWMAYGPVPIFWRIVRFLRTVIGLCVALNVWLLFFAAFLSFEISLAGYTGFSKSFAGLFVGILVPLGNALLGLVIDWLMERLGFLDEDDLRLWRQILNVLVNGAAGVGEIYLVYKKIYDPLGTHYSFVLYIRDHFNPVGAHRNAYAFQQELKAILWPAGMLVPIVTIPLLGDFVPFLIGRLRIKGDQSLNDGDAERIMRPNPVDPVGPYTEMIINFFMLCFCSWISPGTYLITLWMALCIWVALLYINVRLNILRWQARAYFSGLQTHRCASFLLSIPLGFLCAAMDHEIHPAQHSGFTGLLMHMVFHFIFVKYVLTTLEPPKRSFGTTLQEMMRHEHAPIANYLNTNPIEVLKRQYLPEGEPDVEGELIYFRRDKWYLQPAFSRADNRLSFAGEQQVGKAANGLWSATKLEAGQLTSDLTRSVYSSVRGLRFGGQKLAEVPAAWGEQRVSNRAVVVPSGEKGSAGGVDSAID